MDLEKIIELAKEIARPYKITTYVLGILLLVSILANVYLLSQPAVVTFEADNNTSSDVNQTKG